VEPHEDEEEEEAEEEEEEDDDDNMNKRNKQKRSRRDDDIIIIIIIIITYLLTPWCRVLLEKLNGLQLVKKFPTFHGTRRFITALTSARQLSLSWASPIQSIYPHPTSWRSNLILSTHLCLVSPVVFFPPVSPPRPYTPPLLIHTCHMPSPSHSSRFYHQHNIR